jgi:recombination protein RecT
MSQVSTAVALRSNGATQLVESYKGDLASIMPSHMNPDVFTRLAVSVLAKDEKLLQAAQNNPASLMAALWEASRLGLQPGTEQYYLTVRKVKGVPEILGITGYQGEVELIYRAGAVSSVTVEVVRQNDVFVWRKGSLDTHRPPRWEGQQKQPFHDVDWDAGPGRPRPATPRLRVCGHERWSDLQGSSCSTGRTSRKPRSPHPDPVASTRRGSSTKRVCG